MKNRLDQGIASELEAKRTEVESLCRRTNVVSLDLFGSAASRDFRPEASDLDFVVTFAEIPTEESLMLTWTWPRVAASEHCQSSSIFFVSDALVQSFFCGVAIV